ncbi:hypothetical protein EW146_g6216 [Bondarzewia mesenterica]|uniref:Uncharacterized protein n=1 Tax=Bondarzewia mesenterica TaxID=1095465 RepID=A0A4V3XEL3_9AGAM|nr:hypothetical protein EW146_g6216 [Bondarzewia mesenterica]
MQLFSILALALSFSGSALAIIQCDDKKTLSQTVIGENKNVGVEVVQCSNVITPVLDELAERDAFAFEKRQTDVCGATCNTICFTPTGGGPDPNECHVIADALLYDSQNIGKRVSILYQLGAYNDERGSHDLLQAHSSPWTPLCETFIVNQAGIPLQYCRTDWSALVDYIAFNCQSTQNAHGGDCVAADQRWFVQVQHS